MTVQIFVNNLDITCSFLMSGNDLLYSAQNKASPVTMGSCAVETTK